MPPFEAPAVPASPARNNDVETFLSYCRASQPWRVTNLTSYPQAVEKRAIEQSAAWVARGRDVITN
jgi:hypothetical protein